MSETREKTLKVRAKELAADLRSATVLLEQATVQKERAEVAHRHCTWKVEELLRQTERLHDEHDF